jgi:hypothetical protein
MANVLAEDRLKRLLEQYREICLGHNPHDDSPDLNLVTHNAGGGSNNNNDDEDNQQKAEEYTLDEWTTGVQEHRNIV